MSVGYAAINARFLKKYETLSEEKVVYEELICLNEIMSQCLKKNFQCLKKISVFKKEFSLLILSSKLEKNSRTLLFNFSTLYSLTNFCLKRYEFILNHFSH